MNTFYYKISHVRDGIDARVPAARVGKIDASCTMVAMKKVMAAYGLDTNDYKRGNSIRSDETCHVIGMERHPRMSKGTWKSPYTVTITDLAATAESNKVEAQRRLWDAGLNTAEAGAALQAAAVS